ncbi:DUF1294 domain-containing protein [Desertibacillus haloalkaliphilus]|nr:DUF1294 domain-containing protein [Desertibacillus haloalkaliphilus]
MILFVYAMIINMIAVVTMKVDKHQAKKSQWRVPEKRLFFLALFGGAMGIYIGMKRYRHKTKHVTFTIGIPTIIILQIALILFFIVT